MDNPNLSPADFPDLFGLRLVGHELEPTFADGTCLVVSKVAKVAGGDFVVVWLDPALVEPGESNARVRRLALSLMPGTTFPWKDDPGASASPAVVLQTLSPPNECVLRASQVLAMHKIIGTANPDGSGPTYFDEGEVAS